MASRSMTNIRGKKSGKKIRFQGENIMNQFKRYEKNPKAFKLR